MNRQLLHRVFSEIPTLETERLTLRGLRVEDTEDLYEYARRADVTQYLLWSPHPNREYTREFLTYTVGRYRTGEYYEWAVCEKKSKRMIGTCGFASIDTVNNSAEIGYVLNPDYWGRGYMPEAVNAVLSFGFKRLSLMRIQARYILGNTKSRRVMEKCGMHYEGRNRAAVYVRGAYQTVDVFAILRVDYFGRDSMF